MHVDIIDVGGLGENGGAMVNLCADIHNYTVGIVVSVRAIGRFWGVYARKQIRSREDNAPRT